MAEVDNYVKDLTGAVLTDGALAMYCADLGIPRWDAARNATAVMFGDNFESRYMTGEWRSPSIVMYDATCTPIGIPTVNPIGIKRQRVTQLWSYQHDNPEYSTVLPTDFIKIGDTWYVSVMVTQGLGNELRTEFWQSPDLVNWSGPVLSLPHPSHPGNVMLTFDVIDSYVYIFGTGGLARNQPLWLWRNPVDQFPLGWWEPWGWNGNTWGWGISNENTPVLAGHFGEICFRYLGGKTVLSYFDAGNYKMTARVVDNPWSDFYAAQTIDYAFGWSTPQLYGGYIWPQSVLDDPNGMKFVVSQWNTATKDPYHVTLFHGTLATGAFVRPQITRAVVAPVAAVGGVAIAAAGGLAAAAAKGLIGGIQGAAAGMRDGWSTARRAGGGEVSSRWSGPSVQAKTVAQSAALGVSRASGAEVPEEDEPTDAPTAAERIDVPTRRPRQRASHHTSRAGRPATPQTKRSLPGSLLTKPS